MFKLRYYQEEGGGQQEDADRTLNRAWKDDLFQFCRSAPRGGG